jgi:hypothetical protein
MKATRRKGAKRLVKLACALRECPNIFVRRRGQTYLVRGKGKRTFCSRPCSGMALAIVGIGFDPARQKSR